VNNSFNDNGFYSFHLIKSKLNQILDNFCSGNELASMYINNTSDSNIITNNICEETSTGHGITTIYSSFNKIKNNTLFNCVIGVEGIKREHWTTHEIDNTNTINGKPICYWQDRKGGKVPTNVSQIIIINCTNIIIENLTLNDLASPIMMGFSSFNTISDNSLFNNRVAIYCQSSNNNHITENSCNNNSWVTIFLSNSDENKIYNNSFSNATDTGYGLYMYKSNNNYLKYNIFDHNSDTGIGLYKSKSNKILKNSIANNYQHGINMFDSSDNTSIIYNCISNAKIGINITDSNRTTIYHNQFINNDVQAQVNGFNNNNLWDNDLGEGNYWSDYTGLDNGDNGRAAGDGIGDTKIPHLGLDYFPFMNGSGWYYPSTPELLDPGECDSDGSYYIEWFPSRGSIEYILEEDTNPEFLNPIMIYTGFDTIFYISNNPNGTYYYRLRSRSENHVSKWSNIEAITVDWPPNIPKNLTVSVYPGGNALNISWSKNNTDISEYDLLYRSKSDPIWQRAAIITNPKHDFNHSGLLDGLEYEYKIKAFDIREQESPFSNPVSAIPGDTIPPKPPKNLRIENVSFDTIQLSWKPSQENDLEGYCIYRTRQLNSTDWDKPITKLLKNEFQFTDLDLSDSTTYYYKLSAFDEVPNESNYSNIITATTTRKEYPPEINNTIAELFIYEDTIDNKSINLDHWFRDLNRDGLVYSCNDNVNIYVEIDNITGKVLLKPLKDWCGNETVTFTCYDGKFKVSDKLIIRVIPVNDPPGLVDIVSPLDGFEATEGEEINFDGICSDPDEPYGDKLTFHWSSDLIGEFGYGRNLTGSKLPVGLHKITLTVIDRSGSSSSKSVNVTILKAEPKTQPTIISGLNFVLILIIIVFFIFLIIIFRKGRRRNEKKELKYLGIVGLDSTLSTSKYHVEPESRFLNQKIPTESENSLFKLKPRDLDSKIELSKDTGTLLERPKTKSLKHQELDSKIRLIGRDGEIAELQDYLKSTTEDIGNTIFVSGEAGVGKTRIITEVLDIAKNNGFLTLSSRCSTESLTPYQPFIEVLKPVNLDYLFAEECPRIEAVYLVSNGGLLIKEVIRSETQLNPNIFTSMLTAVSNFVKESFSMLSGEDKEGTLNTLGFEKNRILIESGRDINLVALLTGRENELLISDMREIAQTIEDKFGKFLIDWDGDDENLGGIEDLFISLINSGKYDGVHIGSDDPEIRRDLLFENISMGLKRITEDSPVIICIDDLHWADLASFTLLDYITRNMSSYRLLTLATYRPEELVPKSGSSSNHPLTELLYSLEHEDLLNTIGLQPLPEIHISEFTISILGGTNITSELEKFIHQETGGNPLFIIELLQSLIESESIKHFDGTWRLVKNIDQVEIPTKIYHLFKRRMDKLEHKERELLDFASVIGETFSLDILIKGLKIKKLKIMNMLKKLELENKLIYSDNGNYYFSNSKLKDALYLELPPDLRVEYHSIIANVIENLNKKEIGEVSNILAFHYKSAKNKIKAYHYFLEAAKSARIRHSNKDAIRFYQEALKLTKKTEENIRIFCSLGETYEMLGDYNTSLSNYKKALSLTKDKKGRSKIQSKIGIIYFKKGDYKNSTNHCNESLKLVKGSRSSEEAEAFEVLGFVNYRTGSYGKAVEYHKRSLEIREKLNDRLGMAKSLKDLGMVYQEKQEFENALNYYKKSLTIFEKHFNNQGIQLCLNLIGSVEFDLGNYETAFEYYDRSFKIIERSGDQNNIAILLLNLGQSLLFADEIERAINYLNKSLKISENNDLHQVTACDYWVLAEAYIKKKYYKRALDYCKRSFSIASEIENNEILAGLNRTFGSIYKVQRKWKSAIKHFEKSIKIFKKIGNDKELADTYFEYGLMLKSKGDVYKARRNLILALDIFKKLKLHRKNRQVSAALKSI
jgi:parallel beta-helix repeat protein